jgi:hypothetical protein
MSNNRWSCLSSGQGWGDMMEEEIPVAPKVKKTPKVEPVKKEESQKEEDQLTCSHCQSTKDVYMEEVYYGNFKAICQKCSAKSEPTKTVSKPHIKTPLESFAIKCELCKDRKNIMFFKMSDGTFRSYCQNCAIKTVNPNEEKPFYKDFNKK